MVQAGCGLAGPFGPCTSGGRAGGFSPIYGVGWPEVDTGPGARSVCGSLLASLGIYSGSGCVVVRHCVDMGPTDRGCVG